MYISEILNTLCPLGQKIHELNENAYKIVFVYGCAHMNTHSPRERDH